MHAKICGVQRDSRWFYRSVSFALQGRKNRMLTPTKGCPCRRKCAQRIYLPGKRAGIPVGSADQGIPSRCSVFPGSLIKLDLAEGDQDSERRPGLSNTAPLSCPRAIEGGSRTCQLRRRDEKCRSCRTKCVPDSPILVMELNSMQFLCRLCWRRPGPLSQDSSRLKTKYES